MRKPRQGRRHHQAVPDDDDGGAIDAFSIPQFCRRHNISESFFHKLQRGGLGPRTMRIGARTLISAEAATAWRRAREAASTAAQGQRPGRRTCQAAGTEPHRRESDDPISARALGPSKEETDACSTARQPRREHHRRHAARCLTSTSCAADSIEG